MDKYEYKLKLEQLKTLVEVRDYKAAAEIALEINWRKVKSVATLCMVGEIFEKARQFEMSREVLLMAYDRSPVGRNIIYRLTLVALKMGNLEEAQEYYEEFIEIAPHDNMKYVLKYEIARAKGLSIEEQISILEEFKEREYTEEWAFELAYLYHRCGKAEKCVEICDELILWFGEGSYVEKALELKMIYQPLNKLQEDKYRRLKLRVEDTAGVTEVSPRDIKTSGAMLSNTVRIPNIHADTGKFNTVNLQEELVRGMQQIMDATETGMVTDAMDSIKKMVGGVPELDLDFSPFEDELEREPGEITKRYGPIGALDEGLEELEDRVPEPSLAIDFQSILSEEYDGQISLNVPETPKQDLQITGQMSIEDILDEWERTKEAARIAIAEAQQRKLEQAKARALQQAESIMERLNELGPVMEELPEVTLEEEPEEAGPQKEMEEPETEGVIEEELPEAALEGEAEGDLPEAALESEADMEEPEAEGAIEEELPEIILEEEETVLEAGMEEPDAGAMIEEGLPEIAPKSGEGELAQEADMEEPDFEAAIEERLSAGMESESELEIESEGEMPERAELAEEREEKEELEVETEIEEEPLAEMISRHLEMEVEPAVDSEPKLTRLTQELRQIFTYFTLIGGMEQQVCQTLQGVRDDKKGLASSAVGNLVIIGGHGSGKTVLATDFIKAYQLHFKQDSRKVGKISAASLNQKDIEKLFEAVEGGYLIIEKAGDLSKESVELMAELMQQDTGGLLVILEDERQGIEKVMARKESFANMFTECIKIPVFTNDELVVFARAYAREHNCEIEEMGILALYNSISNIQRLDEATTLTEIKEIMDDAIDHASRGGLKKLFGGKRTTEDGLILIKEKDFE